MQTDSMPKIAIPNRRNKGASKRAVKIDTVRKVEHAKVEKLDCLKCRRKSAERERKDKRGSYKKQAVGVRKKEVGG